MTDTVQPAAAAAEGAQLQVTHASGLHAVNRLLAEMHRDMLRSSGLTGAAVRLSVVNVVAVCVDEPAADLAARAVNSIAASHPARAVIVIASTDAPDGIEADLSLHCVPLGEAQICTEQVRLQVGGEPAFHLASVITPLLVPDIPVHLWLVGAPPMGQAFGQDAIAVCERLIIDTGAYADATGTLRTLDSELRIAGDAVSLSDLEWERFQPWRQIIANAFDGAEMRGFLRGIERVRIECAGAARSAQALLLAGWMGSRLGWTAGRPAVELLAGTEAPSDDRGTLTAVTIDCARDGSRATVTLRRTDAALHALIESENGLRAERAIRDTPRDTVDLVSTVLEQSAEDAAYRAALAFAATLPDDGAPVSAPAQPTTHKTP